MISVCIITWNEEIMLPGCLKFWNSMKNVKEICIVDSNSTDKTQEIIKNFQFDDKILKFDSFKFTTFPVHRQKSMDMATQDWIISADADETYTPQLDVLLGDLPKLGDINAVRIPTLIMHPDRRHFLKRWGLRAYADPHTKILRRGFASYNMDREIHEQMIDMNGRNMHECYDKDILNVWKVDKYSEIYVKHLQILKSRDELLKKGERWEELGMLEASNKRGIPLTKTWWAEIDERLIREKVGAVVPLPEHMYDVTSRDD